MCQYHTPQLRHLRGRGHDDGDDDARVHPHDRDDAPHAPPHGRDDGVRVHPHRRDDAPPHRDASQSR